MTLPVFRAIKEKFPDCHLAVMVVGRLSGLFAFNPWIDEIIPFDERTTHRGFLARIRFIRFLRRRKFDTVFLLHRSFTRACLCFCAGIAQRIGFSRSKTKWILTRRVASASGLHRADGYLSLFTACGIPVREQLPQFSLREEETARAREFLSSYRKTNRFLIAFNPSANWGLKRWPAEYFAELAKIISRQGCAIFLIGASREMPLARAVLREFPSAVNLCGRTDLRQLAALLQNMDCLVSADSGPAHLAAAVDTKVLVLFGPTSPLITAPRSKKVKVIQKDSQCTIPCYNNNCSDNRCMRGINPPEVAEKIMDMICHGSPNTG